MGLTYERDDAAERIVVTVTGPLLVADILGIVDRQAEEGAWTYACLYDRRAMTTGPSTADVTPIAGDRISRPLSGWVRKGVAPVVRRHVLATDPAARGRYSTTL
jgi:hypothetical protein